MLGQYGAGWAGGEIPIEYILRFINRQMAAVKEEDWKTLVTVGSWSEHPQSNAYADTCTAYNFHIF